MLALSQLNFQLSRSCHELYLNYNILEYNLGSIPLA